MEMTLDWKNMESFEIKANNTLHCKVEGFNDFIIRKKEKYELNKEYIDFEWMSGIVSSLNSETKNVNPEQIKKRFLNLFDSSMGSAKKDLANAYITIISYKFKELQNMDILLVKLLSKYDKQIQIFADRIEWTLFFGEMNANLKLIHKYSKNPDIQEDKISTHLNHNHLTKK